MKMAIAIKHIDQIAREKQRTVLYLEFHPKQIRYIETEEDHEEDMRFHRYNYRTDKVRDEIIAKLNEMNVPWEMCDHFASGGFMSYRGQIYLDVPLDHDLPLCKALHEYLEYPYGSMRFPTVRFYFLTLEIAMKNAHHDEPGFWDNWAENL